MSSSENEKPHPGDIKDFYRKQSRPNFSNRKYPQDEKFINRKRERPYNQPYYGDLSNDGRANRDLNVIVINPRTCIITPMLGIKINTIVRIILFRSRGQGRGRGGETNIIKMKGDI